jgi:hypothetical protein
MRNTLLLYIIQSDFDKNERLKVCGTQKPIEKEKLPMGGNIFVMLLQIVTFVVREFIVKKLYRCYLLTLQK